VTVRLVEVERGFVLWGNRFHRKTSDLLELQDEIATAVAGALTVQLADDRPGPGPESREQVDAFLRARQAAATWTERNVSTATELLANALRSSPADPFLSAQLAVAQLKLCYITGPRTAGPHA